MEELDGLDEIDVSFMPPSAFGRAGISCCPVLTRPAGRNGVPSYTVRPAIRLSRMAVARDMISQLGINIYSKGLDKLEARLTVAWIKYDLPTKAEPYKFTVRKVHGKARLMEYDAWESLGRKIISQIIEETGYNVDDINYSFCDVVREHFREMYRIAGGATLMAHCARERERVATESLEQLTGALSRIVIEYEDVLPFSKDREIKPALLSTSRMEELAKELVKLSHGDEPDLDSID